MTFPDINLLVYAYDESSEFHSASKKWFEDSMTKTHVVLSWHSITGFLRIITNPRACGMPYSLDDAIDAVTEWLSRDNVSLISLDKKNWPLYIATLKDVNAKGNLVMDAHLAALAMSCGATLASNDRDFRKFTSLKLIDPMASK